MAATAMVVMEPGSEWPAHVDDLTNVVGLGPVGDDLLQRTREKLDALKRRSHGVRVAVLACNAATGEDALGSRATLARTLLGAVAHAIHGRLILSARDGASPVLRRALLTLAEELTDELRGTSASVSLWFTEPARRGAPRLAETWMPPRRAASRLRTRFS